MSTANIYEGRLDGKDRENIWRPVIEEFFENLKSDETPEPRRIVDYSLNGYGFTANNGNEIIIKCFAKVTPVNKDNTEWENPNKVFVFLEMSRDGKDYKVDYLNYLPKNYDKFLEAFEEWKQNNETVETVEIPAEKEDFNANAQIKKINNVIIIICVVVIVVVAIKLFKNRKA